jgi:hypothetical protein
MIRREECAACGAGGCLAWSAVVSPFVAERLGVEAVPCRLLECRRCAHRFFLEHLSEPAPFLAGLAGALGPRSAGHWLYAEVPLERFRILVRPAAGRVPARPAPEGALSYGAVIRIVARHEPGGAGNGARGAQP